jgi:MOSC domain-containing protein
MPSIESIWRYPIKGLTPERLNAVTLTPGRCLPHDRRFALARSDTEFDPARPEWLPKQICDAYARGTACRAALAL